MLRWVAVGALCALLHGADRSSPGFETYQRANTLFAEHRFAEAIVATDSALQLDRKLVPALTLRAKLALAARDYGLAAETLQRAISADPSSAYAQFLYGFQFYLRDDLEHALPELEKARTLNPADARAALYTARTLEGLGRTNDALARYAETVRLESKAGGGAQTETLLAGARLLLVAARLDECALWIDHALKLDKDSRDVHYELSRLLLRRGDSAAAVNEALRALSLTRGEASDAQIHYLLALGYRRSDPGEAARHARLSELN